MSNKEAAKIFKAFSDERRLEILTLLVRGERCACKLLEEVSISQATLSHHMRILCEADVVISRKDGKWIHYSINQEGIETAKGILSELVDNDTYNKVFDKSCES